MSVPFIRIYVLAGGKEQRGSVVHCARSPEIEAMAARFLTAGGWYQMHLGTDGKAVRLTCTDPNLCVLTGLDAENGPQLLPAVDDLVCRSQDYIVAKTPDEVLNKPVRILN